MPMKFCLTCKQLTSNGSRCEACQAKFDHDHDQARGTTRQRGLGGTHRRRAEKVVQGIQACPRCGESPTKDNPMTAHHTTPRSKGGDHTTPLVPLCRRCNSQLGDRQQ